MKVVEIKWLDRDEKEAVVTLSDEHFSCNVYAMPCDLKIGQSITYPISSVVDSNVFAAKHKHYAIEPLSEMRYKGVGKIFDKSKNIIEIGRLKFALSSHFPGDCDRGDWIEFISDGFSI